jgi:hypothetical protein
MTVHELIPTRIREDLGKAQTVTIVATLEAGDADVGAFGTILCMERSIQGERMDFVCGGRDCLFTLRGCKGY